MKMTINPQNWIDDSVEISINKTKKTVRVNGEVLKLTFKRQKEFEIVGVEWDGEQFTSMIKSDNYDLYCCSESGIEREHSDPYVLAAIMASNLI